MSSAARVQQDEGVADVVAGDVPAGPTHLVLRSFSRAGKVYPKGGAVNVRTWTRGPGLAGAIALEERGLIRKISSATPEELAQARAAEERAAARAHIEVLIKAERAPLRDALEEAGIHSPSTLDGLVDSFLPELRELHAAWRRGGEVEARAIAAGHDRRVALVAKRVAAAHRLRKQMAGRGRYIDYPESFVLVVTGQAQRRRRRTRASEVGA